jgi:hypothetical protein
MFTRHEITIGTPKFFTYNSVSTLFHDFADQRFSGFHDLVQTFKNPSNRGLKIFDIIVTFLNYEFKKGEDNKNDQFPGSSQVFFSHLGKIYPAYTEISYLEHFGEFFYFFVWGLFTLGLWTKLFCS